MTDPRMPSIHAALAALGVVSLAAALAIPVAVATVDDATEGPGLERAGATACGAVGGRAVVPTTTPGDLSVDTFVAPGATYDRLRNASALDAAREDGYLTPASAGIDRAWEDAVVAYRDVIVHRLALNGSATALLDRLAAQERGSPTANFRALVASGAIGFEYLGPTACPPRLALNASLDRGAIRVVPDGDDDALFLVFDTDRLLFHPLDGDEPTTDTRVYGHHGFELTLPASSGFGEETLTVETDYQVEAAGVSFAGGQRGLVRLDPTGNRTVRGRTTLAPGSEVAVTLHPVGTDASVVSTTATVNGSRGFAARFDRSRLATEGLYVVAVSGLSEPPVVVGGATLVAVGSATGALVTVANQTHDRAVDSLYPFAVTTTDGGFVVVRNASGGRLGVSEYLPPGARVANPTLSPSLRENGTVTVTVYRDANGNREFDDADVPYRVNGSAVRDTARVGLDGVSPTATPTRAPPQSGTPTAQQVTATPSSPSTTPGTSPTPTPRTTPGFGAVVALLAMAVLGVGFARRT